MQIGIPGGLDPQEDEMATHSSILAWRIPWTEEPGRPQPVKSWTQLSDCSHANRTRTPEAEDREHMVSAFVLFSCPLELPFV